MRFCLLLLSLLTTASAAAQVQVSIEATGGTTLNQLRNQPVLSVSGANLSGFVDVDYPLAAGLGASARVRVGTDRLAGRASVGVHTTGTVFDLTIPATDQLPVPFLEGGELSLTFVTAGLEAEAGSRLGGVDLYVFGGPELRYLLPRDDEGALDLRDETRYHAAATLGAGARFRTGAVTLAPEVVTSFGLAAFADDTFGVDLPLGDLRVELEEGFTLDSVLLQLAVGVDL